MAVLYFFFVFFFVFFFDGNISSPGELDLAEATALGRECGKQIVMLGALHGYRFTISDLSAVVDAFQLVNSGQLTIESCTRILGLGKAEGVIANARKTAGMIYRGVQY